MAWLSGWSNRIELDIDYTNKIGASVTGRRVIIFLKSGNGDTTDVFTEIGSNSQKMAITQSDGTTQLYAEIELWDTETPKGIIHVSKSDWTIDDDTSIYLYYDNDHADNTDYIGTSPDDAASNAVWKSDLKAVYHMNDATTSTIKDSTSNNNDGTKKEANEPVEATGLIGDCQDFDGINDYINLTEALSTLETFTIIFSVNPTSNGTVRAYSAYRSGQSSTKYTVYISSDRWFYGYYDSSFNTVDTGASVQYGSWESIGFTYDGTTYKFYINDSFITSTVAGINTGDGGAANLGCFNPADPSSFLEGLLDGVLVANAAWSLAEIKMEYNTGNDSLLTYGSKETAGINVNDSITITEDVTLSIPILLINVNDSVTVEESISASIPILNIDISDSISIAESVDVSVVSAALSINVSDSISITENVGFSSWVSPTGHSDPDSAWTDETKAYDNDTETYAYNLTNNHYLELTLTSPISCDKVRIHVGGLTTPSANTEVDVYYGDDWHNIYSDTLSEETWVTINIGSTQIVSKARIRQTAAGNSLYVNEFDFNKLLVSLSINVYDSITITEDRTVQIPVLLVDVNDSIAIAEEIFNLIPELFLQVSDDISVSEYIKNVVNPLIISVYDSISVDEYNKTVITILFISQYDSVSVDEYVKPALNLAIIVSDSLSVSESIGILLPELFISAYDTITVNEYQKLIIDKLFINVSDSISISEYIKAVITKLFVNVYDSVSVEEYRYVSVSLAINIYDEISVNESVEILLPELFISVSDTISLAEYINALIPLLFVNTSDSISINDIVSKLFVDPLFVSVFDSLSVNEYKYVAYRETEVSTFDTISLSESVSVAICLAINVADAVSVAEQLKKQLDVGYSKPAEPSTSWTKVSDVSTDWTKQSGAEAVWSKV